MKSTITFIILLAIPFFVMAQSPGSIEEFYYKYRQEENTIEMAIEGWLLKMASQNQESSDDKTNLFEKIDKVRVLVMEEKNTVDPSDYKQLIRNAEKEAYSSLIEVNTDGEKVDIMMKEDGDTITNVLLVVSGEEEFVMINLTGNLKYEDLENLDLNIDGGEHFKKIKKSKDGGGSL